MASILLSFVGTQDPFSGENQEFGSIVSLTKHLQGQGEISQVLLLYTKDLADHAEQTRDWLLGDLALPETAIVIKPVSEELSDDPINPALTMKEVRNAVDLYIPTLSEDDWLEFNASSGTPTLKTAWSILQASGYIPQSRLWQVRNPTKMKAGQERIFQTDLSSLKREFDLKILREQIATYDYGGALITAKALKLHQGMAKELKALLEFGRCRLSFDFDGARVALADVTDTYPQFAKEINLLSPQKLEERKATLSKRDQQRKDELDKLTEAVWLQEGYFKLLIHLKRKEFADALVDLFRLVENIPGFIVKHEIGIRDGDLNVKALKIKHPDLYSYLSEYQIPQTKVQLNLERGINRIVLIAILSYKQEFQYITEVLHRLDNLCNSRNKFVHSFCGISGFEDQQSIVNDLRTLIAEVTKLPEVPPFERLNQDIEKLLQGI